MEKSSGNKEWALIQRMLFAKPPPFVTAQSWAIADGYTGKLIFGRGETEKREIASLTKIMTAYTALQLIKKFQLLPAISIVTVSENSAFTEGTSAYLEDGDKLTLRDLFYGLLLPSGNDAAVAIAEYIGEKIIKSQQITNTAKEPKPVPMIEEELEVELELELEQEQDEEDEAVQYYSPCPIKTFVKEMNEIARQLELKDTFFANPHGLMNFKNRSSACDIAKLSFIAMKDKDFKTIVNCKKYICKAKKSTGEDKKFRWKNTNKLLGKGFSGIKTGITYSAGPCLATSFEKDNISLIIVVLNSKTMDQRWDEVKKLANWATTRINKFNCISKKEEYDKKQKILQMLTHV